MSLGELEICQRTRSKSTKKGNRKEGVKPITKSCLLFVELDMVSKLTKIVKQKLNLENEQSDYVRVVRIFETRRRGQLAYGNELLCCCSNLLK